MPKVIPGESEKDFVDRCVPMVLHEGTAKDGSQAAAVCYSMYKEHKETSEKVHSYKYCDLELKDLSEQKGIVSFYFSPIGVPDVDKDEAAPGAFDKTFKENKARIKHFRNHNKNEVPGTIIELGTDSKGAFARSQLALKTSIGNDTFEQYKAGIITEHSYGFIAMRAEKKATGGRILKEVKMFEASSLTHWGASQYTPVMSLKSIEEASDYIEKLNKLLTTGHISDELGQKLEVEIKSLYENLQAKIAEMKKKKESDMIDFGFLVNNLRKAD